MAAATFRTPMLSTNCLRFISIIYIVRAHFPKPLARVFLEWGWGGVGGGKYILHGACTGKGIVSPPTERASRCALQETQSLPTCNRGRLIYTRLQSHSTSTHLLFNTTTSTQTQLAQTRYRQAPNIDSAQTQTGQHARTCFYSRLYVQHRRRERCKL